jgi:uncharacterized phiE125 gp8 family phage protein
MTYAVVTPPAVEPVTVEDLRAHLRLSGTQEDGQLAGLIKAARSQVEQETRRALIRRRLRLYLEYWPLGRVVMLPVAPVLSVVEIIAYDLQGNGTPLAPEDFSLDRSASPARVRIKPGAGMPSHQLLGIEIDFDAGYGDGPEDVPNQMRQAVRLLAAHWFENREAGTDLAMASLPHGLDRLLSVNKVLQL